MITENVKVEFRESYGARELPHVYVKHYGQDIITKISPKTHPLANPRAFLEQVFLPQGFPCSVSDDYVDYQTYDTIQAFCSCVTGTLTTKAILKSVGVGDAHATPIAAATMWVFKDGIGKLGSITFAWLKGTEFDSDCKKWRLFADMLNDGAMLLEMLLPYFPRVNTVGLCVTSAMKAAVGVSGSATRAAITQHQAIKDNMADVSAKDGSQETAVNLLASVFAVMILTMFPHEKFHWLLFGIFTVLHLFSNYLAVKSLKFDTLNAARYRILLMNYFRCNIILTPTSVNEDEPVVLGTGSSEQYCCGFDVTVGESLSKIFPSLYAPMLKDYLQIYADKRYLIIPNVQERKINVVLHKDETAEVVLTAYFNALLLGIAISIERDIKIDYVEERSLTLDDFHIGKELTRLVVDTSKSKTEHMKYVKISTGVLDLVQRNNVVEKLRADGWKTDKHAIKTEFWRIDGLPPDL